MRSRDQQLLEEAYKSIYASKYTITNLEYLNEKGFWKNVLPYAAAAGMATGIGLGSMTPKEVKPYDVSKDSIHATSKANYEKLPDNTKNVKINSITTTIEQSINNQISELVVEIIESTDMEDNNKLVIVEITGNVLATSQQQANKIASNIVLQAMKKTGITVKDLVVVSEEMNRKFPIKLKLTLVS